MKKLVVIITVLLLIMVGCNKDDQESSDVTASDVFTEISKQLEEVNNYTIDFSLNQEVVVPEVNEPIIVKQEESTYIEVEPFQFLTDVQAMGMNLSLVYKDEQLYSYQQDELQPINDETINQLPKLIEQQRHLPVLIELFQSMEDQFELKEDGEQYRLVLNGEGESFQSFVKNQLETASFGGKDLPIKEAQLDVKNVNVEIVVNKESYEVISLHSNFSSEQNETSISQDIKREYDNYNEQANEIPGE